ncbi:MAG: hypothetical protein L3J07_01080 [Candidatus Magasanikbacteria bacterium]|nr:hypothetical protein [Candidatus Magasanikbacteria bacterium]
MKKELYYFPNWVIIDYLSHITSNKIQDTDNIEMICSLVMSKFCERQFGKECFIGFEVKESYKRKLPKDNLMSEQDFINLIKDGFFKDTPIDFSIAIPSKKGRIDFQLKRFGKSLKQNNTNDLINYINDLSKEYGDTDCNLIILCESCEVSPLTVSQKICIKNYPFKKIILIDVEGSKYIYYHGIWSDKGESGTSRFNMQTMKFDY